MNPSDPNTDYLANPFTNPSAFTSHITPAVLSQVRAKGYDHLRLQVAPGPWMDGVKAADEARIEALFVILDTAIDATLAGGLKVMLDMHDAYYVKNMPPELLSGGISSAIWLRRVEVTRRFAARYSRYSPSDLCLELFNEPLAAASITGLWSDYLWSLYVPARNAMPRHTLLLTAENYSSIDQLVAFNPSKYGNNTLWVIHPYIPAIFAIQGYSQSSYNKYVYGLAWPPNPADKTTAIAAMTANVNADSSLTSGQKTAAIASQTTELGFFFDVPLDGNWIKSEFDKIDAWLSTYGIVAGRIIANEYGVTRTNDGFNDDGFTGAPDSSRIPYINQVTEQVAAKGYRRSVYSLDALDYGVTDGSDSDIGTLISGLIA